MGIKESIGNFFLNKSNSYRFYKDYYDQRNLVNQKNELKQLKKDFKKFKRQTEKFKRESNEYMESFNYLFNNIYLDYTHEPKKSIQSIQSLCSELLVFVDKICKKYSLQWWLDGGNLLGAVRHENYVPWDDDVDIGMIRSDYNKFRKYIRIEVEERGLRDFIDIDFRRKGIDKDLVNTFVQLWIKKPIDGKNVILGGVDIFPFDYITAFNTGDLSRVYHESRLNYYRNLNNNMSYSDSLKILYEDLDLSMEPTDWIVPGVEGSFGPTEPFKITPTVAGKIFPLKELKFGDNMFPAPNDPHYYLKKIYGDYMRIPKKIDRHGRVNNFRYIENSEELFDECLERMREVNENF